MIFYNANIFTPDRGIVPGRFEIEGSTFTRVDFECFLGDKAQDAGANMKKEKTDNISASQNLCDLQKEADSIDLDGALVLPGLIDIHTHGNSGADFSDGDKSGLVSMAQYLLKNGITGFLPTSMTLPKEKLEQAFRSAYEFTLESHPDCANVLGIHMEGPFLSLEHKGAQNAEYLSLPDIESFLLLQASCNNMIKIVDVAPELDGAIPFIQELASCPGTDSSSANVLASTSHTDDSNSTKVLVPTAHTDDYGSANVLVSNAHADNSSSANVLVSVAHTDAGYEAARIAFEAGARHVTHLFNGMKSFHHRDPGILGAAAENDNVTIELICDGIHVHPSAIRLAFKLFPHRICLISDSLRCCGMPDGEYELGGQNVYLKSGEARLCDGTLAGSVTNLFDCMKKAIEFGIPMDSAIEAATYTPAKCLNLEEKIGQIKAGCDADFIICDSALNILKIYKKGMLIP